MTTPILELPLKQRHWFIQYHRLYGLWIHLGYNHDEFPRLRDGPIINRPPWQDPHHPLNRKLDEVMELIEVEYGPHWSRWQDYQVQCYQVDETGELVLVDVGFPGIEVSNWKACRGCKCLECYRQGLCGLGCLNEDKQCQNILR